MKLTTKEIIELCFYAGVEEMVMAIEDKVFSAPYPQITLDNFYDEFSSATDEWYGIEKIQAVMVEHRIQFSQITVFAYKSGIQAFIQRLIYANENKSHLFDDPEDDGDELIENIIAWIETSAKGDLDEFIDPMLKIANNILQLPSFPPIVWGILPPYPVYDKKKGG